MGQTRIVVARCALVVLALTAAGIAIAARDAKAPPAPKVGDWIEVRTANFTIYSNTSTARTRKIAVSLERFRDAMGRITRGMKLDTRVPTRIYVFKNDPSYRPYKLDDDGRPQNVSGYFLAGPFVNAITLDASAGDAPMRVVYHEYFHAIMDASLGNLPLWLNEGLAEYYSTFQNRDASTRVEVGHPIEAHVRVLQSGQSIPWDDVFATTTDSPTYNEAARQGAFYAQSWLLVHYLASDGERAKQLGRYLTALRLGTEEAQAFADSFDTDRAGLGAAMPDYLRTGGSFYTWDLGEQATEVTFATRELERAEALFRLGDLLARRRQGASADSYFTPARALGWAAGPIETSLGFSSYYRDDDERAEAHFRAAIAAGDASPEPYVLLADLIVNRYRAVGFSAVPSHETAAPVLEARALFEAAPQPEEGEYFALTGLANTYLLGAGDVTPGVAAVERALILRPLASDTARLRACLLARQGRPAEAWSLVARDLSQRDPEAAREAAYCISDAVVRAAWERSEADDRTGADGILQAAEAATPDPAAAARFAAMRRALAGGASIVFAEPEQDDTIERYNQAASLAEAGRYDEAIAVLESLLEDCDDQPICPRAEESVTQLRGVARHNGWVARFNAAVDLANNQERRGAIEVLRELEVEVTDPRLHESVVALLKSLGARPSK